MTHEEIVDELTLILPNAGILQFNDLKSASELDEIYERVLPFEAEPNYCHFLVTLTLSLTHILRMVSCEAEYKEHRSHSSSMSQAIGSRLR